MERMESSEVANQLLKKKYNLHASAEAESAAKRTQAGTGEKVSQDPLIRIQNYLDRLNNLIHPASLEGEHRRLDRGERNIEMLKHRLYDRFVIHPSEIPESYWENQRRIIRERGQEADLGTVGWKEFQRQNTEATISDQKASLDKWIDYFASPDSSWVPDALKYYSFRSILSMSSYDKDRKVFPQRSKGTARPFPDLNREALAYVLDAIAKKYSRQDIDLSSLSPEEQSQFEKLLQSENFSRLYAFAIEKVTPASSEQLSTTSGKWIKYERGSDHMRLVRSIQGHGTGWCTVGESTAKAQLEDGDFYIYYSNDHEGNPTIPRAAIRMEGRTIAEVRGIGEDQNLDGGITPVVDEKLKEFSDGETYKKKVSDMQTLTAVDNKIKNGEALTREELIFLYEMNSSIEGFGYSKDPRAQELRDKRNSEEDALIILNLEKEQLAVNKKEITANTKAYIGRLEPGIFDAIQKYDIEHVYTSFPESRIIIDTLEIGGKSKEQILKELQDAGINVDRDVKNMIGDSRFTTLPNSQSIATARVRVQDLGFDASPTTKEIYEKANTLGLHVCPAEAGLYMGLKDTNQHLREYREFHVIAMDPIPIGDNSNVSEVFSLIHKEDEDGLRLSSRWAGPENPWYPDDELVFSLIEI